MIERRKERVVKGAIEGKERGNGESIYKGMKAVGRSETKEQKREEGMVEVKEGSKKRRSEEKKDE